MLKITWGRKGQFEGTSICVKINADLVGITRTLQRSQLWSPQGVVWLHVILHIWQLNQRSKCQIRCSGTLCGFVTLPRGRWIHKAMNGLQWGINIAFSSVTYNPTLLFLTLLDEGNLYPLLQVYFQKLKFYLKKRALRKNALNASEIN